MEQKYLIVTLQLFVFLKVIYPILQVGNRNFKKINFEEVEF